MAKSKRISERKGMTKSQREELLIENFVGLQSAMTHLSLKFENLSDNISRLLEVLELSAKNYLSKEAPRDLNSSELAKQVDYLINQNKALAEGLLLIDDTIRKNQSKEGKEDSEDKSSMQKKLRSRPLPRTI